MSLRIFSRRACLTGALLAALALSGCASVDPGGSLDELHKLTRERSQLAAPWLHDDATRAEATKRSRELLAEPLDGDAAAELALLNAPTLQARLEELGVAQADLAQAALLANPTFGASVLKPSRGSGSKRTASLEIQVLDWLVQPLRRRVAEAELVRVRYEIGAALLDAAAEARLALLDLQTREQLAERLAAGEEVDGAAVEFARELEKAGNLTALEVARARAAHAKTRADLAEARRETRRAREAVHRALGLPGEETAWTAAPLPEEPPAADLTAFDDLERLAAERRLDLEAARAAVDGLGRALALKKKTRFLPVGLDVGVETERELDGLRLTGPTVVLQLPLFDTGRAGVARLEAELRRARWQLAALTLQARSEVREKHADLAAARERTAICRDELLPASAEVLDLTLRHYNMMLLGTFDVLAARQRQVEAERGCIEALSDAWEARIALERAVGTRLDGAGPEKNPESPAAPTAAAAINKETQP
jgi:outer membrane protein, heavy metal efflux system